MTDEKNSPTGERDPQQKTGIRKPSVDDGFFLRMYSLIRFPSNTWKTLAESSFERKNEYSRYYIPAVVLWLTGSLCGYLVFGAYYPVMDRVTEEPTFTKLYPDPAAAFGQQILCAFFYLLIPFIFAKPMLVVSRFLQGARGRRDHSEGVEARNMLSEARRLILFSFAPVLFASAFQLIPLLGVLSLVITLHGMVILYKGMRLMLDIDGGPRISLFVLSMLVLIFYCLFVLVLSQQIVGNPFQEAMNSLPQPTP